MSLFRVVSLVLVVGCGKSVPPTVASPPVEPPAMEMPSTKTAEPSPGPEAENVGTSCELEVARVCPDGMVDGCGDGRTLHHVCVAVSEVGGQPCEQEVAKVCADGQVDACLHEPKLAATHLCVVP